MSAAAAFAVTEPLVRRILDLMDHGVVRGLGEPEPGKMCIEALVCFALGLPHGDDPGCVAPALRALKIRLNDSAWSSDATRAKGLRKLAVLQLGTVGVLDEKEFLSRVVEMTIRKIVPRALRSAAGMKGNAKHATNLEVAAKKCETEGTRQSALDARDAANAAAYAAAAIHHAATAAAYAANAAANAAAIHHAASTATAATSTAALAAGTASAAANAAAYAANAAAYAANAKSKARDESLAFFAEEVSRILIDMKVPAIEWLGLLESSHV